MAKLMEILQQPETWNWLGGVGQQLDASARGQGFDLTRANAGLMQGIQDRQRKEQVRGLMAENGNLTDYQRKLLDVAGLDPAIKILLDRQGLGTSGDPAVWRQKMNEMVVGGMDPVTARNIATGAWVVTDEGSMLDKSTGMPPVYGAAPQPADPATMGYQPDDQMSWPQSVAPAPQPEAQPAPPTEDGQTLWNSLDAGAGLSPALKHFSTDTLGQIPGAVGDWLSWPETVKARKLFDISVRDLARSLSDNPRYPEGMMQDIIRRSGMEASAWTSEESTRAGVEMMDGFLRNKIAQERKALSEPGMSPAQRNDAVKGLREMERFVKMLGVPQAGQQPAPQQGGPQPGMVEDGYRFKGGDPSVQSNWEKVQ
jgi:hypothetical protein